jgi:L-rhamnose-H+ transport protein
MEMIIGILLVAVAGLGTGTCAWPMKKINKLQFEQYWFIAMLTGLIIIPWAVVFIKVPDPITAYKTVGLKPLLLSNLFSMCWGIANVIYGVCVVRIGAALTGAVLSALGLCVGVVFPMILKGTGLFSQAPDLGSPAGMMVLSGVAVIIIGVVFVSMAGFGREQTLKNVDEQSRQKQAAGGFLAGLILVIAAGILSCGISLAFVYSQGPIVEAMTTQGVGNISANISVWAGGLVGGALVNLLYPAYLMTKKKTWHLLFDNSLDINLSRTIGVQFILSIILLGLGMRFLGVLGASIGFGIQQAMQLIGNQLVGFLGGEWKGVTGKPRLFMYTSIIVILIAVIILAYSNTLI